MDQEDHIPMQIIQIILTLANEMHAVWLEKVLYPKPGEQSWQFVLNTGNVFTVIVQSTRWKVEFPPVPLAHCVWSSPDLNPVDAGLVHVGGAETMKAKTIRS